MMSRGRGLTLDSWLDLVVSTLWARALGALASLTLCGVLAVVRHRRRSESLRAL
jgi:hypothetical protein